MKLNEKDSNKVEIEGTLVTEFELSHTVFGENFYKAKIAVDRLSETEDVLQLLVSEQVMDIKPNMVGTILHVNGQFRSFNYDGPNGKRRLLLSIFAKEVTVIDEAIAGKNNNVSLTGYVCKEPAYRTTPLGREITDLLIAVNRPYGSDYIPCVTWGKNARYSNNLKVGSKVMIWGRIQSREYTKWYVDKETKEVRTAYEVSVSTIVDVTDMDSVLNKKDDSETK